MSNTGSHATFVERIERHRGILFRIAAAYCAGAPDREDLIQETIAQLWRSYGRFDERAAFSTWMYRVAMNVAISFSRRQALERRTFVSKDESAFAQLPAVEGPDADEHLNVLHEMIDRFAPLDRALMVLYLDELTYAEIASILGISESNVGTKIGRIKQRLRREALDTLQSGGSHGTR